MVVTSSARESISKVSPLLLFSVLCAISLAIWWGPLTSSFALALHDGRYSHILLILPVSTVDSRSRARMQQHPFQLKLVVTTMVLAQMLLRSVWRRTLVIALAIPLSVAKNGLRIFVLAMLATRVDRSFMSGRLHHQGGIIYFLIALAVILVLIRILRRSEEKGGVSAKA